MRLLVAFALSALGAIGQTTPAPTPVAPAFPAIPLPTAIAVFGEFNQLANPRFTGGVAALYPIFGSAGVYGTTTADILPKLGVVGFPPCAAASGQEGWLPESRFPAPRSQGNWASRTAMAWAVVSLDARGSGTVGRGGGMRARRARWLQA